MPQSEPRERKAQSTRRVPQVWPPGRKFRILSIDGGGIRGVFPAAVLAGLEDKYTRGRSISAFFDLVVGTSTGGIIAVGLGSDLTARDMLDLYVERGCEVFPPYPNNYFGAIQEKFARALQYAVYRYSRKALEQMLFDSIGCRLFGESKVRLCIPSFDGEHGSVYVFKTPHDPIYTVDRHDQMVTVAMATAAAPTFYQPLPHRMYRLVDGGVWANNPIMIGLTEALVSFDVSRDEIEILSIGCGDELPVVTKSQRDFGGILAWSQIFYTASNLQSQAVTNQARLILGPKSVIRCVPKTFNPPIRLDDWRRAVRLLQPSADALVTIHGDEIAKKFLQDEAEPFVPEPISN